MTAWPMPDMQRQIDAVREAFSQDTRKPFVLKPSFPYGSPQSTKMATPPRSDALYRPNPMRASPLGHHVDTNVSVSYTSHPITPPVSAGPPDLKGDSSPASSQSLMMMAAGQSSQAPSMQGSMPLADAHTSWNPTRIFE